MPLGPSNRRRTRNRDLWLAAAVLPAAPAAASIAAAVAPADWLTLSTPLVRALTPDALLYSAVCVVIAAPLAGVAVATDGHGTAAADRAPASGGIARSTAGSIAVLVVATLLFGAVSAALTAARLGLSAETWSLVWTSHAALASVTLALAALGALCGRLFRHPLDAAACSLLASILAAGGVLVIGSPAGNLPPALLGAAVIANPLLSLASAAHIDIVRTDILYQISPLAHVQVDQPAWTAVCAWYLAAGFTGFLGLAWTYRQGRGAPSL